VSEARPEVFGPYLVYEQLGRGGMAQVHRAVVAGIEGFERPVALKRMLPHLATNQDSVKAFVREARLASYLRHANVAQTYELGKVDDIYFIAMELVTGHTLRAVLRHCAQTTGPMPVPIALNIINQLCDALDYAHNLRDETGQPLGIIHRDVSPSNIIVSNTGVVKLIDFGIAKATGSDKTATGMVKGKFAYMAPEYLTGQLDLRADLFGLGVIAHELLTNRPLFHSKTDFTTITRLRDMPIQPPSRWNEHVTRDLDDIVMTALQRTPELRWQSASAMRIAITNVLRSLSTSVTDQQLADWVVWAFTKAPPKEDSALVRVIDALAEPTSVTFELNDEQVDELEQIHPAPAVPRKRADARGDETVRTRPGRSSADKRPAVDATRPEESGVVVMPARPRSVRAWLLLILMLSVALWAREELEAAARALYELYETYVG
jgi:serine/threonine protein kinase